MSVYDVEIPCEAQIYVWKPARPEAVASASGLLRRKPGGKTRDVHVSIEGLPWKTLWIVPDRFRMRGLGRPVEGLSWQDKGGFWFVGDPALEALRDEVKKERERYKDERRARALGKQPGGKVFVRLSDGGPVVEAVVIARSPFGLVARAEGRTMVFNRSGRGFAGERLVKGGQNDER